VEPVGPLVRVNKKIIILFFMYKENYTSLIHFCSVTFILFKKNKFNVLKNECLYHLKKLILRVTVDVDLVLSKVLYLKFVNKKILLYRPGSGK